MKTSVFLVALSFVACSAFAADKEMKTPSPAQQAQQAKMKTCNADAGKKGLKGDERKKFMSECLKSKPAAATQQNKMKTCNADAGKKGLKGDERKAFMSDCLKGDKM